MSNNTNLNIICPDCNQPLVCIYWTRENGKRVMLGHCDQCINGVDSDWRIILNPDNSVEKIERYFWG